MVFYLHFKLEFQYNEIIYELFLSIPKILFIITSEIEFFYYADTNS